MSSQTAFIIFFIYKYLLSGKHFSTSNEETVSVIFFYVYLLAISNKETVFAIYAYLLVIAHFFTQDEKFKALYKLMGMTL